MAENNFEATEAGARSSESQTLSNAEVQSLYSEMGSLSRSTTSPSGDAGGTTDRAGSTLEFNTLGLYGGSSSFFKTELSTPSPTDTAAPEPDGAIGSTTTDGTADKQAAPATDRVADATADGGASGGDAGLTRRQQGTVEVAKGENLYSIAARVLGPDSSPVQRYAFLTGLRSLNQMQPGSDGVSEGQKLKIPGVNDKGEFVHAENGVERLWSPVDGRSETRTADGTRLVNYLDGSTDIHQPNGDKISVRGDSTRVLRADGVSVMKNRLGERTNTPEGVVIQRADDGRLVSVLTGPQTGPYARFGDGDGGTVERVTGQERAEGNFTLVQTRDGKMEVADRGPDGRDRVSTLMGDQSLTKDRGDLIDRAERHITDPAQLAKFKADMVRFESRAQERGLKPDQVRDTYKAIGRLFDGGNDEIIPQSERNMLAQQVMNNAASPTSIDQGYHNTCNMATVESNIYTRDPERAAGLVADVALTGKYTASDGTPVTVPAGVLTPDHEAVNHPPVDGKRSFASQMFQMTAINLLYQKDGGWWTYTQTDVPASERETDTGERARFLGIPHPFASRDPGVTIRDMARTHEIITGRKDRDLIMFVGKSDSSNPSLTGVSSPSELTDRLDQMQRQGRLPTILLVHTGNPPFSHQTGGWHVVSITGSDAASGTVQMDNQWGGHRDRISSPVGAREMFLSMMSPQDRGKYVRQQAAEQARLQDPSAADYIQGLKSAHLLSMQGEKINGQDLRSLLSTADRAWQQQRKDGQLNPPDQQRFLQSVTGLFETMPRSEQLAFLDQMKGYRARTALPEENFNEMFGRMLTADGFTADSLKTSLSRRPNEAAVGKERYAMLTLLRSMPTAQRNAIIARTGKR